MAPKFGWWKRRSVLQKILMGLVVLVAFAAVIEALARMGIVDLPAPTTEALPAPGTHPEFDADWLACAADDAGWLDACDGLVRARSRTVDPEPSELEYFLFGSSCGARLDPFIDQSCSRQWTRRVNAPPDGLAVRPWNGYGITTLCVETTETYADVTTEITPVGSKFHPSNLLKSPFYLIVVDDSCDATMTIDVEGRSLTQSYGRFGLPVSLHTGAEVTGTMTLSAPGQETLIHRLSGRKSPPESVTQMGEELPNSDPEDAPYWSAVHESVNAGLAEWFGPSIGF